MHHATHTVWYSVLLAIMVVQVYVQYNEHSMYI